MACEVTIQDVQRNLKNRVVENFDGAKPINNGTSVLIPSNISNARQLGTMVSQVVDSLNEEFGSELYGESISYYKNDEFGYIIDLHPSEMLAEAMTLQNLRDEVGQDFFMGDTALREQEGFEAESSRGQIQKPQRPLTDNFYEYFKYKENLLSKTSKMLKNLRRDRKNPKKDIKKVNSEIQRLSAIQLELKQDIEALKKNDVLYMFNALTREIEDLNKSLDDLTDIEDIKGRLEFLYKFVIGTTIDNTEVSDLPNLSYFQHAGIMEISKAILDLNTKYLDRLSALKDEIINQDVSYVNNILNNSEITEDDIKNMFNSMDDIGMLEKTFLGIGQASGQETVLTQIIKSFLETKNTIREAEVKVFKDRLTSLMNKMGMKADYDFIFERTEKGSKTGNIIHIFSPKFHTALNQFFNIGTDDTKTPEAKYKEKLKWLSQNADFIDFTKLKAVKDLYGHLYPEHFTATDQEMSEYEDQLADTLGPVYQEEIEKVLHSLNVFEDTKIGIQEAGGIYAEKNIARVDPWAFLKHFKSAHRGDMLAFDNGSGNFSFVYPDIQNVRFIPKTETFLGYDMEGEEITKSTGFYNEDFKTLSKDADKLEYWKLMTEIYKDYVNPTYESGYSSRLSFAKFEEDWLQALHSSKGLQKGTALYKSAKSSFKSFFYESGQETDYNGIRRNYGDVSKKQVRDLTNTLKHKTQADLQALAQKEGIDPSGMNHAALAKEIATKVVMESYSTNINKVTMAILDMTALQKAKEDTLPIANILFDAHKTIKNDKGEKREKSIARLEDFIERVIKNQNEKYRGSSSMLGKDVTKNTMFGKMLDFLGTVPFVKKYFYKQRAKFLSDSEKSLLQHLQDIKESGHNAGVEDRITVGEETFILNSKGEYTKVIEKPDGKRVSSKATKAEFEAAFQQNIEDKIESLGLDLNAAGLIQGVLKMIILKGLGLNPISGIFNRIEGKNSALIMDQTGQYWKKGNLGDANHFMAFANFINFLPERFTPGQLKKVKELNKLKILIHNMNIIQDRKNELDRNAESSKFDYEKAFNIFQFAVDNPEFKNQGAILLSILMDQKILNTETGTMDPIFDGSEFIVYDEVDGKLVLKKEYRTPENIANWENFEVDEVDLTNNHYLVTKNKIKNAISRSQGNYDNLDVIGATRHIFGRAGTVFMKWMPEHYMQRFSAGKNDDIFTGKKAIKGRYTSVWQNNPALLTTGLATLFVSFGLTPAVGLAGLGLTGVVIAKYIKNMYGGNKGIQREANTVLEFVGFAKSIVVNTLNYPVLLVNGKQLFDEEALNNLIPSYNKSKSTTNLSDVEIGNLQAVARELGIKLTFLALLLMAKAATWDDDDDKDSTQRKLHNFADNQLTRVITSLSNWTDPGAFKEDLERLAFLKYLLEVGDVVSSIITGNDDGKLLDKVFKASPLPRMLYKGDMPWLDEREYDNARWEDRYIKNLKTNGEWSNQREYEKIRKDKKDEFRKIHKKNGLEREELERAIDMDMKLEFPRKTKEYSYGDMINRIEGGEKGSLPKEKKKKNKFKRKTFKQKQAERASKNIDTEI